MVVIIAAQQKPIGPKADEGRHNIGELQNGSDLASTGGPQHSRGKNTNHKGDDCGER